MDVKKVIWIAIGVVVCIGLGVLVVNLIFGTDVITNVFNGMGQYVNDFWQELTGSDTNIFEDVSVSQRETIAF